MEDDISDALRLQDITYLQVATVALMLHEWLILFDREVEHIWRKDWNISKILFIISRYGLLLDMPITITMQLAPYGAVDHDTCNILYKAGTWFTFFGISVSESILLFRTNAIYSGSKRVAIPLTVIYVAEVATGIAITWIYLGTVRFGSPPNPLIEGCYLVERSVIIFFDFLMLLIFELVVVILTVRKGYRDFHSGTPLLRVIYRDSAAFFLILFVLTLSTILLLALAPPPYSGLVPASIRVAHSIVCCRIILNLRQAASPGGTLVTTVASGLMFVNPPGQQTDQTETMQLEACGSRKDEEDPRGLPQVEVPVEG